MHHIDPQEAQEVVRLAAARKMAPSDGPTVGGLAEALGLSESEVERLLTEVRSRNALSEPPQRRFGDRSAALSAAIVLALVLVVAAVGGAAYLMLGVRPQNSETMTLTTPAVPTPSGVATAGGGGSVTIQTAPDGGTTITDAEGVKTKIRTTDDGAVRLEQSKPLTGAK